MDDSFAPQTGSATDWNFLFHAEFLDSDSGLYNYGYRYYNPQLGRWPSRDPIGEDGGLNLYGFAINNAVRNLDLFGLRRYTVDLGDGWTAEIDSWEGGFEAHVKRNGHEVGIANQDGWVRRHGHSGNIPDGIPQKVLIKLNGAVVKQGRRSGVVPEVGRGNIKGIGRSLGIASIIIGTATGAALEEAAEKAEEDAVGINNQIKEMVETIDEIKNRKPERPATNERGGAIGRRLTCKYRCSNPTVETKGDLRVCVYSSCVVVGAEGGPESDCPKVAEKRYNLYRDCESCPSPLTYKSAQ
jgi:RHS repeat-associated protein